jgi:Tol biopolymer transport system component
LLLTSSDYAGLSIMDLSTGTSMQISGSRGAGYEPSFTTDGQAVIFREDTYRNLKRYSSLAMFSLKTGRKTIIEPESRDLGSPVVAGDKLHYRLENTVKGVATGTSASKSQAEEKWLILENMAPVLYVNKERRPLKPNGEGYYIWPSLSPDGSRILYNFNGICTYVCDNEGKIIAVPGRINAPRWLTDNIIIGMDDRDDGYRITSSEIVCYSIKSGTATRLTSTEDIHEIYPVPFPGGEKVIYQASDGRLFIMYLKIK